MYIRTYNLIIRFLNFKFNILINKYITNLEGIKLLFLGIRYFRNPRKDI